MTGHTGFKGSWLSVLLSEHGYTVHGLSFDETQSGTGYLGGFENLFESTAQLDIGSQSREIADYMEKVNPDFIFHLAALSQVRDCQDAPAKATATNIVGTANFLQAVTERELCCPVIVATTDKVYAESDSRFHAHTELSELRGSEAYSISKVSADQLVDAYARIHNSQNWGIARAGNVIGGGDRASYRLMTEVIAGLLSGSEVSVRNPNATRPWQHVLDCVFGYVKLAEHLHGNPGTSAWNFGPPQHEVISVSELLSLVTNLEPNFKWLEADFGEPRPYESQYLSLDSSKAQLRLGWHPKLSISESVQHVISWEKALAEGKSALAITRQQAIDFMERP